MKPLAIAIDVDETVADLLGEWLRRYNERSGDSLLPEDLTSWSFVNQLRPEWQKDGGKRLYDILWESDMYRHVLPIQGAREAVERLTVAGHHVFFVSSCSHGTELHKIAWLKRYGFISDAKRFVSAGFKGYVRADALIDDGPHNCEAFPGTSYLVTQGHNRTYLPIKPCTRVSHISQAADLILRGHAA